ncbi:MAG: ATP-binding protein, partial [Candidatus Angelobacter sp.]
MPSHSNQTAFFRVDPRLAALLGENYRSSELAIKELIDNSWDADSDNVWVALPGVLTGEPIAIKDDGSGMTEQEVRSEYLTVARDRTTTKGELTSRYKRSVKGQRGIGKFAGLMVADHMSLETRARGRVTRLEIPRQTLETAARDLEQIPLPINVSDCAESERGTTILLAELNQRLTFPDEDRLRELLVLEYGREEGFAIWVNKKRVTADDIPGQQFQYSKALPFAGEVFLTFKISPDKKPIRNSGITLRIGSKVVGKPRVFGLDSDPDVPRPVLKRLYGEVRADALAADATADWEAIVENSKGYAELEEFVRPLLKEQIRKTFKQEFSAQNARVQREVNLRLAKLPENRREYAKRAIERIMLQFYGEKEERIIPIISVVLDAMEHDEYWEVLREIDRTPRTDVQLFAESLGHFGIVEMALIGRQAQ